MVTGIIINGQVFDLSPEQYHDKFNIYTYTYVYILSDICGRPVSCLFCLYCSRTKLLHSACFITMYRGFIRIFIELLQGTQNVLTFKEYGEKKMTIVAVAGQAEYLTVSMYVI